MKATAEDWAKTLRTKAVSQVDPLDPSLSPKAL